MIYADSSFIVRLVTSDFGSEPVVAEFRRLGRPQLVYSSFLSLEVTNALNLQILARRASSRRRDRSAQLAQLSAASSRLARMVERKSLLHATCDWEECLGVAKDLSNKHTPVVGTRALDLLHLASAIVLKTELFLTCDKKQARVAKMAGREMVYVGIDEN
jgi:predicted nucleic acid-binding protein